MTAHAPEVKPAAITLMRVIRRTTRTGFGGRKHHCGYWLEITIDGWLVQRGIIKRDTFDYLKDHGVEVVQEKAAEPPVPAADEAENKS